MGQADFDYDPQRCGATSVQALTGRSWQTQIVLLISVPRNLHRRCARPTPTLTPVECCPRHA